MTNKTNKMTRENKSKLSKKEQSRLSKREEMAKNKKKHDTSDSEDDSDYDPNDVSEEEMDPQEYRKFLAKIFPSKYLNNKIKDGEKVKKVIRRVEEDYSDDEESEEEIVAKKSKKNKKVVESETDDDDEITIGSQDTEEEEDEEEEYYEEDDVKGKKSKLNIILTIGGAGNVDDDEWETENDDDYDENYVDSNDETEDEDASVSSASSDEEPKKSSKSKRVEKRNSKEEKKSEELLSQLKSEINEEKNEKIDQKAENEEVLTKLRELQQANKNNKTIQKCIEMYEEEIQKENVKREKKVKKQKDKHMRIFRKIVKDKNTSNDFTFYEKLDIENQKRIIKELREINKITRIEKPYRMTLLESSIPVQFKAAAMKKINSLRHMEPGSGEYYKIKNWVDTFMRIPFGKFEGLPISMSDGVEKCHDFMEKAQKTLDDAVYGLNDAKMQIMQMLGQLITNPKAIGTAIAIHGPPGSGKTSLVKEGISKILNRPFAFIALGGATDSSFLEGHGYTYEGSTWGKILQILIDSKCMNPVIYFDELDKISETPRGEEIAGILTHLTDTSQNSQFHDKYFAEINFDLSKCLFIFSYNDEHKVNAILKDRMYRIKTKGYSQKEKTIISNNYLLPRIREQVKFNSEEIVIPDSTIHYIVESHCDKEDGVRNLKRCLEIIHTKLNLYRLMRPGSNLFEQDMALKVEFPFTVTKDLVDKLIKKEKDSYSALSSMYV
jgi:ATP-dependent Lon protease